MEMLRSGIQSLAVLSRLSDQSELLPQALLRTNETSLYILMAAVNQDLTNAGPTRNVLVLPMYINVYAAGDLL